MDFSLAVSTAGKTLKNPIPVEMNYRIIELFSKGLYRSPFKPIEELVVNGYDAFASHVHVVFQQIESEEGLFAIIDDGDGMGVADLEMLWKIGYSQKNDEAYARKARSHRRLPIGQFGIGKLAPYVLAKHLIHVCKNDGRYFAIDMDFARMDERRETLRTEIVTLPVHEMTATEAKTLLEPILDLNNDVIPLFGKGARKSWTVAVMSGIRDLAKTVTEPKLRWIISTGLPLTPDFAVHLNGEVVEPFLAKGERVWTHTIGKDDQLASALNLECREDRTVPKNSPSRFRVVLPNIGEIWGKAEVFRDTLKSPDRKADRVQRSHGYFIMIRERLVNTDDPLFGLQPLSHKTFNRFRMVIYANGLNPYLRSSRESILEAREVDETLIRYMTRTFNEGESQYEDWLLEEEVKAIRNIPPSLIRDPLQSLLRAAFDAGISDARHYIKLPETLVDVPQREVEKSLRSVIDSIQTLDDFIVRDRLGYDQPFALFDAERVKVIINEDYPLYANYAALNKDTEPLSIWGLAEVLLEAYLVESGLPAKSVDHILQQRDGFLRRVVGLGRKSAVAVARELRQAVSNEKALERTVGDAFTALGFDVTPIGGKNDTDGVARAHLGVRGMVRANYTLIYDAKSTGNKKVSEVNFSRIGSHRKDHKANYVVVVGRDFPKGRTWTEAVDNNMLLCKVETLAQILEVSVKRPLTFIDFENLLKTCHQPDEVEKWIVTFGRGAKVPQARRIFRLLLEAIEQLQKDPKFESRVTIEHIHGILYSQDDELSSPPKVRQWLDVLFRIVPDLLIVDQDAVYLNQAPSQVLLYAGQRLNAD